MAKVTSKLQVTIPKRIAEAFGIRPGDDVAFVPAGDSIRVTPAQQQQRGDDTKTRLALFDAATRRQKSRDKRRAQTAPPKDRGWTREELYERDRAG